MLDKLKYQCDVITLESGSGAAALENAVGRLPDFFATVRDVFSKYLGTPVSTLLLSRFDISSTVRFTQSQSYADLRKTEAYVPPGLKVDYLTYTGVLKESAEHMRYMQQHVLSPFETWLASKLGNPASLAALTVNLKVDNLQLHKVDELEKKIQACFDLKTRQMSQTTYGDVIKRNADWSTLLKDVDYLNNAFDPERHDVLVSLVNRCTSLIDTLMQRMREEPEVYKISPPAVAALANVCYQIARELEFYGLLRQRITELDHAISTTTKLLSVKK